MNIDFKINHHISYVTFPQENLKQKFESGSQVYFPAETGNVQRIKIRLNEQGVYAQTRIYPGEWEA